MGLGKPKVVPLPNQQTNTFTPVSIANTPEAKAFLDVPINPDPGAGRRTDLAEQTAQNRWNSAFMGGVPSFIKQANEDKEERDIRGQGAAEEAQANYMAQGQELQRRGALLPRIMQTGSSGYTSQGFQQPSFWSSFAGGLGQGIGGGLTGGISGMFPKRGGG